MKKNLNKKGGFTLIEILVVIGIIAILAAIVIIAINPAKQFAQARNTQRTSNINAVLNSIGQRIADNKGIFEGDFVVGSTTYSCPALPTTVQEVCIMEDDAGDTDDDCPTGGVDLSCLVPTYIATFPVDPTYLAADDEGNSLYTIDTDTAGRITVCAPLGDESAIPDSAEICVTR